MTYRIFDEQGNLINIIVADAAFVEAHCPGRYELVPEPEPTPSVPQRVTRRQARQALLLNGLLDQVPIAIAAIEDPVARGMAQIEWEDSQEFERRRPLVISIGAAMGLDLDALFIQAGAL